MLVYLDNPAANHHSLCRLNSVLFVEQEHNQVTNQLERIHLALEDVEYECDWENLYNYKSLYAKKRRRPTQIVVLCACIQIKKNFHNRLEYYFEWSSSDKDESGPRTFVNVETPIPANPVVASLKVTAGFEASPLSADY